MTSTQRSNKFWVIFPYVVLALVLFAIFAIRTRDSRRMREYEEALKEYQVRVDSLDRVISLAEVQLQEYSSTIEALETDRINLEKKLVQIKQKYEKDYSHIVNADTDWNIQFLSDFLSSEDGD